MAGRLEEFRRFLAENRRWWLPPALLVLALLAALFVFARLSPETTFVYSVF